MIRLAALGAAIALSATAAPAVAQVPYGSTQEPSTGEQAVGAILNALFGDRLGVSSSLEGEWSRGRRPLYNQRNQFEARLNADVRSGALSSYSAQRLSNEYDSLVELEARYAADGRMSSQERADLTARYRAFSQRVESGGGGSGDGWGGGSSTEVADGQREFDARVDAQVRNRRLTRTAGSRLKSEYASLIQTERSYARDGRIDSRERNDLNSRLDDLDRRVGDSYGGGSSQSPRDRLDAVGRAISYSGLSSSAQAQLRVEHEDLTRLEAAYSRLNPSSDERDYLERRIADLESRARVRR